MELDAGASDGAHDGGHVVDASDAAFAMDARDASAPVDAHDYCPDATTCELMQVDAIHAGIPEAYGTSVAVSADGDNVVVGAPTRPDHQYGGISIVQRIDGLWSHASPPPTELTRLNGELAAEPIENQLFGASVAMSASGDVVVVGAYPAVGIVNAVYVFRASGSTWTQTEIVGPIDTRFGHTLSLSGDGMTLAVGAYHDPHSTPSISTSFPAPGTPSDEAVFGSVFIYGWEGDVWQPRAYIKPMIPGAVDAFGASLALSADGNVLAVGAPFEPSRNAESTDSGAPNAGAAYVFERESGGWSETVFLKANAPHEGDFFGAAVAVSGDGNWVAVGVPHASDPGVGVADIEVEAGHDDLSGQYGSAYVFHRSLGGGWARALYCRASYTQLNAHFGFSVALSFDGSYLAVGSPGDATSAGGIHDARRADADSEPDSGAVYTFLRGTTSEFDWTPRYFIKADIPMGGAEFGNSLALSHPDVDPTQTVLVVGAQSEAFLHGATYMFVGQ